MKLKVKTSILIIAAIFLVVGVFSISAAKKYSGKDPWLGVFVQDIDRDLAEAFNIDTKDGALIVGVSDDSPAEKAGLKKKDVIIKFNGKNVYDPDELIDLVDETKVGDEVEIVYIRKGKENTTKATIGDEPGRKWDSYSYFVPKGPSRTVTYHFSDDDHGFIGVGIMDLNEQLGEYFGIKDGEGVLITEVYEDSPAETAGLKAGDVVVAADGEEVFDTADLQDIVGDHEDGDTVEIAYVRKGSKSAVKVEVEEQSYSSRYFKMPAMPAIPKIPAIPRIPNITWHSNDWDDYDLDEYDDAREEYEEEMENLREELQQMQKELQDIREKLE